MPKVYLRELQDQLSLIKERIAGIHIPRGPCAVVNPELLKKRAALIARKRVIEDRILNWDPDK